MSLPLMILFLFIEATKNNWQHIWQVLGNQAGATIDQPAIELYQRCTCMDFVCGITTAQNTTYAYDRQSPIKFHSQLSD